MNKNESEMLKEDEIYEISFIFNPNLQEELANQKLEVLKNDIASLKGSFISEEAPYIRDLSYEMTRVINNVNTRFKQGYFGWVKFYLQKDKIENINKKLKLDEEIIRFLIVKADKDNDIFTKELSVIKSEPDILQKDKSTLNQDSIIDTTELDLLDEDIKEIEEEIEL